LSCENNDRFSVYNEDRSFKIFDYCLAQNNETAKLGNFVIARAKYVLFRMQTLSDRVLSSTFELFLLDLPNLEEIVPNPPVLILESVENQLASTTPPPNNKICPLSTIELTETSGTIEIPNSKKGNLNNLNCSWLIKAPHRQRVYLIFDYISIPASPNKGEKCSQNYISIKSKNRPTRLYKLCGEQRSKKFITNYNDVFINFITESLEGISAGFSLVFKIIGDNKNESKLYMLLKYVKIII